MPSADVCCTLPKTTWSMSSGATRACASAAFAAITARSVAVWSLSAPPRVPNGVRLAPRIQISRARGLAMPVQFTLKTKIRRSALVELRDDDDREGGAQRHRADDQDPAE